MLWQSSDQPDVDLDHVILGVPNLTAGIREFARLTGVTPQRGGRHPGPGTENALVSLGAGHYLELLAPIAASPDSAAAGTVTLRPVGWALHTRWLDQLIGRLKDAGFEISGPNPGSRVTPDSTLLQWRTANVGGPGLALAPFFIEWAAGTPHPSTTSPGGCTLEALELSEPEPARLEALFHAAGYRLPVRKDSVRASRLVLDCPRGRVSFPP